MGRLASAGHWGFVAAGAVILGCLWEAPSLAQVTTSTTTKTYPVPGTTAKAVIRYMQGHPIRGDNGSAFANIRPRYTLSVKTAEKGAICRATDVDVKIHFTLTLPQATGRASMSSRDRKSWDSFAAFIRNHEDHHRRSYTSCAKSFVQQARRESASSCFAVESSIRRLFDQMKRDCEAKQVAWDRTQKGALRSHAFVRRAGY